jgi:hypothetical protein
VVHLSRKCFRTFHPLVVVLVLPFHKRFQQVKTELELCLGSHGVRSAFQKDLEA